MKPTPTLLLFLILFVLHSAAAAQPVTGFWKGRIARKNVELKIIKNGDSLSGTSYYYESVNSYRRYSIKGYFDDRDNSVVWWDDQLLEAKNSNRLFAVRTATPFLSTADFNCPGGTKMYLTGKAVLKDNEELERGPINLQKMDVHTFNDEWDFVIENYTFGANDPELVDSIGQLVTSRTIAPNATPAEQTTETVVPEDPAEHPERQVVNPLNTTTILQPMPAPAIQPVAISIPLSNEQKFATRGRQLTQEIPVSGDSIELRLYDNAEVDGDSIAIFLNNQLLYEHIRLSDKGYTIKLAVASLQASNELVMVAENLGSIPPNTSVMVAMVAGKRYETRLESTEQTSAVIRFVRRDADPGKTD